MEFGLFSYINFSLMIIKQFKKSYNMIYCAQVVTVYFQGTAYPILWYRPFTGRNCVYSSASH